MTNEHTQAKRKAKKQKKEVYMSFDWAQVNEMILDGWELVSAVHQPKNYIKHVYYLQRDVL